MGFRIGQRVTCIAPHPEWEAVGCKVPQVGSVYTIRGIDDLDGLLLEEVINEPPADYSINVATGERVTPAEDSFWQHRFRAIVERRQTDISIFKRILDEPEVALEELTGEGNKK